MRLHAISNLSVFALSLGLLVGPPAAAQNTLPGGHATFQEAERATYEAALRIKVDSFVVEWQSAFRARDAKRLSGLYAPNATMTLSTWTVLRGRSAIRSGFERLFTRMRAPRISVTDVRIDGTSSIVHGTISFEVIAADGTYRQAMPIAFALGVGSWDNIVVHEQEGGDIPSLAALTFPPPYFPKGTPTAVRVRLVDASGEGVTGATISFTVGGSRGAIEPASALTDAQGIAVASFAASTTRETDTVTAVAELLPEEPATFYLRVLEPSDVAAAQHLLVAMGVRAQLDSALSRTIDDRRQAMPNVPASVWSAIPRDSAVNAALVWLAPRYAERFTTETMRAMDSALASPTGHQIVAAQSFMLADLADAERQWNVMLDARLPARPKGGADERTP